MPSLALRAQIDDVIIRIVAGTVTLIPQIPFSGGSKIPPGTQNEALAYVDANFALMVNTVNPAELGVLRGQFDATREQVDNFDASLSGLEANQTGLRDDLNALTSTVSGLNTAGLSAVSLDNVGNLIFTYADGTTKNFGFFPAPRTFRGYATAKPTVSGVQGDIFFNFNPGINAVWWLCTVTGVAQGQSGTVAVWEAKGVTNYGEMVFDFDANRAYRYPTGVAGVYAAPSYYGGVTGSNVVWQYAALPAGASWVTASFPLTMAANSILRATVSGLAAGAWGGATLQRIS